MVDSKSDKQTDEQREAFRAEARALVDEVGPLSSMDPITAIMIALQALQVAIDLWRECRAKHSKRFVAAEQVERNELAAKLVRRIIRDAASAKRLELRLIAALGEKKYRRAGGEILTGTLLQRGYGASFNRLSRLAGD